jgi:Ca-activated chloride channel family protein
MRFADPYLLGLLLVVPVLLFLKARFSRESGSGGYSDLALLAAYRPTWRVRYRWLPAAARGVALALLVVALARPQTGRAETEVPGEGIDIVLVMDTSSSMSTSFGDDSRLSVAQRVLTDFVEGRAQDRIGLVIFREQSLPLSPLTLDYSALQRLIGEVSRVNLSDGTAIGVGLSDGLNLLRDSRARSRVVILMTDGENNAGSIEPLQAARIAETLGIRVYTIGVVARGGDRVNVDERALQEMAQVTGGRYFPAESEGALAAVYDSIDRLEKSRVGRPQFAAFNELAPYLLLLAFAFAGLEIALRALVWRQAT